MAIWIFFFFCWKITIHNFSTILCHVGFTKLSKEYSQTDFPTLKTKPYKVTKYKIKNGKDIQAKEGEDKNLHHFLIFVIKI